MQLLNKPPKWNELKQIYMLDFKGRVDKPSVKNFILTHKDQDEVIWILILASNPTLRQSGRRYFPPGSDVTFKPNPGSGHRNDLLRHQISMLMNRDSVVRIPISIFESSANRVLAILRHQRLQESQKNVHRH